MGAYPQLKDAVARIETAEIAERIKTAVRDKT